MMPNEKRKFCLKIFFSFQFFKLYRKKIILFEKKMIKKFNRIDSIDSPKIKFQKKIFFVNKFKKSFVKIF